MVVVTSSKLAKECFTEKDAVMASRPQLAGGKHMSYDNRGLVWAPYGQYWRDLRKLCILQLLSTRRIENWKHIRIEEVSDLVEFLYRRSRDRVCVNMSSKLSELSFNIIIRMVMNKRYFGPQAEDCKEARKFKELIKKVGILSGVFNLGDYIPLLRWLDLQGYERAMKELNKQKDRFLQEVVDAHKQRVGMKDAAVRDFIDVLLDREEDYLNENESLKSTVQVGTCAKSRVDKGLESCSYPPCRKPWMTVKPSNMIAAGTETSSLTIEWALAAVMKHPSVMRRAQNEIDSFVGCDRQVEESDLPKLKYLQAIVKETFRLYPVAPLLVPHQSTAPCTVGGYHIPAGTHLVVNAWALHRDSSVWERPLEFVPERFLEREEIDVKGKHFEMIPFGSGRRGCPGAALGLCIVQFSLARLIHSFQWSLPNGQSPQELDMTEGRGLTMPRAIPLIALPKPRLPLHLYHSNPSPQA
eukprot:Gb_02188 [translate_table: standard]